jgi:hypothetical protein
VRARPGRRRIGSARTRFAARKMALFGVALGEHVVGRDADLALLHAPRAVSRDERRLEPSAPRQPRMAPARHTLAAPHRSTTTQRRTRNSEPAWKPGARTLPGVARLCWDLFSLPLMMPGSGRPCAPRACQWSGANDTSPAVSSDEKGLDCMRSPTLSRPHDVKM